MFNFVCFKKVRQRKQPGRPDLAVDTLGLVTLCALFVENDVFNFKLIGLLQVIEKMLRHLLVFLNRFFSQLLLILFVNSCRLGPEYRPPVVETPEEWKQTQELCRGPVFEGLWWEVFNDPVLNSLEQCAIEANPTLFIALDHVAQARAIAGVDKAALYPQLNLNPSYSNTGMLFKIYLPNGGTFLPGTFPTIYRIHQLQYALPLNLSYELDLWRKLRGQFDSAVFNAQAQEENLKTALLTLTADVAIDYYTLRMLDLLIETYEENLRLLRKNLEVVQSRFEKGLVNQLDVITAQQELADNEASYLDSIRQRALQENAIGALVGLPSSEFRLERNPLAGPPPAIQASLPSEVLLQRPDLSAAERSMAAQHALIGVAYASFFPSIELTGTLGYLSPDLEQFLKWKSRLWAMGMNATQPIFDGGRNTANLQLAYADYYETLHTYQKTVLTAFREVEDALVNIEMQSREYERYQESVELADKRFNLTDSRYRNGLSNYLSVLDSERTRVQAQTNLVNILGQQYVSTVQLIKALGGSWTFSLQSPFEKPGSSGQSEDSDDCHWPDVVEDNISGDIF